MTTSFPKRIPSLDGLRAISIVLVLWGHLAGTKYFPFSAGDQLNLASLGVRVFFVISGFLITGILLKELARSSTIDLKKFYFRRTLRIFPPYYFFLGVLGIIGLLGFLDIKLFDWLAATFYLSNFFEISTWEVGHTWSLAVEEQFYLIMPFLLYFFRKKSAFWILCAAIIVAPLIRFSSYVAAPDITARWIGLGFQANADSLATGCLLAFLYERLSINKIFQKFISSKLFILVPIIAVTFNLFAERPKFYSLICITIINFSVVLCIYRSVTIYEGPIGRFLNSRPVAYFGTLSYSIYLWQQLFLNRYSEAEFTSFPINLLLTLIFSLISFYLVEKPSLRLRTTIENRIFKIKQNA